MILIRNLTDKEREKANKELVEARRKVQSSLTDKDRLAAKILQFKLKLKEYLKKDDFDPLVNLPADLQVTLYLIKQELRIRRFFNIIAEAGLDGCDYEPHLDSLILRRMGLDDDDDETFDNYYEIMERRSRKIEASQDSITGQALKVYAELVNLKERLGAVVG